MFYKPFILLVLSLTTCTLHAGEWTSNVSGQWLAFTEDAAYAGQHDSYLSIALETEFYHDFDDGSLFVFKPFGRIDQYDEERSHVDLRELSYTMFGDDWELLMGVSKVFWGATEAIHLVDIINQTDLVENLDGEDKLGQPMIRYTLIRDAGTFSFFVLPGFRERTFPSSEGRPRTALPVDPDFVLYWDGPVTIQEPEADDLDYAVRWTKTLGDWDVGLSYFEGFTREPKLSPLADTLGDPTGTLGVLYDTVKQTGIDATGIIDEWLFKLEMIYRVGQPIQLKPFPAPSPGLFANHFFAAATGVEYTFVGVMESDVDIGLIVEYLYDERVFTSPFQNDIVIGARFAMNDVDSTELLVSMIIDTEGDGQNYNIEGSKRIGSNMTMSIEARGATNIEPGSPLQSFEKDDRIRAELTYYF